MAETACQRWRIVGRVQGVGYRAWMVEQAHAAGIDGWVRNLASGDVEAVVLGTAASLARLHEACLQGPRHACVERIERSPLGSGTVEPGPAAAPGFRAVSDGA